MHVISISDYLDRPVTQSLARDVGRVLGFSFQHTARNCPFPHDQLDLRNAWLDGFSLGRIDQTA